MDVDHRHVHRVEKITGEDLHVASEHHEVALSSDELEQLPLGVGLVPGLDRHVVVGDAEQLHVVAQVRVVRRHQHDLALQLAALPAPEHVLEAVVVAGHEHGDALALARVPEAIAHVEAVGHLRGEALRQRIGGVRHRELHPQVELAALGVRAVLVGLDDVRARLVQEAGHRAHDPGPVGAPHEQPHERAGEDE